MITSRFLSNTATIFGTLALTTMLAFSIYANDEQNGQNVSAEGINNEPSQPLKAADKACKTECEMKICPSKKCANVNDCGQGSECPLVSRCERSDKAVEQQAVKGEKGESLVPELLRNEINILKTELEDQGIPAKLRALWEGAVHWLDGDIQDATTAEQP